MVGIAIIFSYDVGFMFRYTKDFDLKEDLAVISPWSISFHYIRANQMFEMEKQLYGCRKTTSSTANSLNEMIPMAPTGAIDMVFREQVRTTCMIPFVSL